MPERALWFHCYFCPSRIAPNIPHNRVRGEHSNNDMGYASHTLVDAFVRRGLVLETECLRIPDVALATGNVELIL